MQNVKKLQQQQQPGKQLNLIEQISQRFTEKLVNTPFPMERLSHNWLAAAFYALDHASPVSTGMSHSDLSELHKMDQLEPRLSYNQFAALSNNLDSKSPQHLALTGEEYASLLDESINHINFFAEQTAVMRKASEEEIAAETSDKKDLPLGAFAPVKAKA